MAFMGMFIIFIVIAGIILFGMLVGGVILLVVGGVKLRAHKRNGEPLAPAVISFVLGAMITLVPLSVAGLLIFGGVSNFIKMEAERSTYSSFIDKWKNPDEKFITDTGAMKDCFIPLLQAADTGDPEELKKLFAESEQSVILDNEIKVFLNEYPKGLSLSENTHTYSGGSGRKNGSEHFTAYADAELNGEYYYINIYACFRDEEHPENVGIKRFTVRSQTAEAIHRDKSWHSNGSYDTGYKHIFCKTITPEGIDSCRAETEPYIYHDTGRVLTFEEVQEAVRTIHSFDSFTEKYGEPNVSYGDGWKNYYDLEPDGGKRRYLCIYHHDDKPLSPDDFMVCGTERDLYIFFDENGNIKEKK